MDILWYHRPVQGGIRELGPRKSTKNLHSGWLEAPTPPPELKVDVPETADCVARRVAKVILILTIMSFHIYFILLPRDGPDPFSCLFVLFNGIDMPMSTKIATIRKTEIMSFIFLLRF